MSDRPRMVFPSLANRDVVKGKAETRLYYGRPLLPPPELDEEDEVDEPLELETLPPPLFPEECDDDPDEPE